jgi:Mg-chelatase subunit ChlD
MDKLMTDNKNTEGKEGAALAKKPEPFKIKAVGLQAKKQALANKQQMDGSATSNILVDPSKATHKIGIVFDDSGSMGGSKITDAHAGCEEFLRSCNPTNTAVSVYPMNPEDGHAKISLTSKMYDVATAVKTYHATGSTPMFETLTDMLDNESLTRGILFSDGSPNHTNTKEATITKAIEKKIPIDTVFIGYATDTYAIAIMKEIAERTGGIFMIFEPGKANFKTAFKYLSPGYRAMLMDKSFVEKLQEGKI